MSVIPRGLLLYCLLEWASSFHRILSPIFSPASTEIRAACLLSWLSLLFHLLFHAVPLCLFCDFLLALSIFPLQRSGKRHAARVVVPTWLEKVSKILGCSCSWIQILCVILIEIFVGHLLTFSFLLLASGCMHCKN